MAKNLQFKGDQRVEAAKQIKRLYQLFRSVDATQVEINPFAETPEGRGKCYKIACLLSNINFNCRVAVVIVRISLRNNIERKLYSNITPFLCSAML